MEFAGPAPLGPFASLAAEMPLRRANDVKQVQPGAKAGGTAADTGRDHDNSARTAEARDITALRREVARRDLPAGPPPAFQISQLELDADLQQIIARVEAARTQLREAEALTAEAKAEERQAQADMDEATDAAPSGAENPDDASGAADPADPGDPTAPDRAA